MPAKSLVDSLPVLFIEIEKAVRSFTGQTKLYQTIRDRGEAWIESYDNRELSKWSFSLVLPTPTSLTTPVESTPLSVLLSFRWMSTFRESQCIVNRPGLQSTLDTVRSLLPAQRYYCHQCSVLFSGSDLMVHSRHSSVNGVGDESLLKPTRLLTPVDNRKSQAVSSLESVPVVYRKLSNYSPSLGEDALFFIYRFILFNYFYWFCV